MNPDETRKRFRIIRFTNYANKIARVIVNSFQLYTAILSLFFKLNFIFFFFTGVAWYRREYFYSIFSYSHFDRQTIDRNVKIVSSLLWMTFLQSLKKLLLDFIFFVQGKNV